MRRTLALAITALLFVSLAPLAEAHAAPVARGFETRILHDHNDDSAFLTAQNKHGFDAIALDVREGFELNAGPVMIFRLLLNGGCNTSPAAGDCPELSHVVKFKADGADQSVTFATADAGATWTGDAVRYVGPHDINDGTRFAIEGWVPMANLNIATGSVLTDWFVEGYAGATSADNMPEGLVVGVPDPLEGAFLLESYTVKSPDFYLDVEAGPASVASKVGDEVRWAFNLTNLLSDTQVITFSTIGLPATIERGTAVVSEEMAPNVTRTYDVVLAPQQTGTVIITSDLGGAVAVAFQVKVPKADTGLNILSPDILPGGSHRHTFGQMGTVMYHDHHNMASEGKIIIGAPNANKTTHTISYDGTAFTPAELTIGMGDTVIWQNDGDAKMKLMGSGETGHEHGEHEHAESDDKESPGAPLILVALGLLGAVFVARRK